jgi:hypothetical protein
VPRSRSHRIGLAATIAFLLVLGGLMALGVKHFRTQAKPARAASSLSPAAQRILRHQRLLQPTTSRRPAPAAAPRAKSPSPAELASAQARERAAQHPSAPAVKQGFPVLKLLATRGRCWVEVRKVSSSGAVLFTGILETGKTKKFHGKTLWVRLGAPETIDAFVDDRLRDLPGGTLDFLVTRSGVVSAA